MDCEYRRSTLTMLHLECMSASICSQRSAWETFVAIVTRMYSARRLQVAYHSSSGVAKGPSVPYTGEALLRNNAVASTSARELYPPCTASRPFVSSAATLAADGGLPTR